MFWIISSHVERPQRYCEAAKHTCSSAALCHGNKIKTSCWLSWWWNTVPTFGWMNTFAKVFNKVRSNKQNSRATTLLNMLREDGRASKYKIILSVIFWLKADLFLASNLPTETFSFQRNQTKTNSSPPPRGFVPMASASKFEVGSTKHF